MDEESKLPLEKPKEEQTLLVAQIYGEIEELQDELEMNFWKIKNFDKVQSSPTDHRFSSHDNFVKVYESRPYLMRAIIKGPPNTIYYNALFCFDICFTCDYPNQPPKLFYHSYDYDLNPNLKKSGKVNLPHSKRKCSSNPFRILDILVTIQGFLNDEFSSNKKNVLIIRTWEAMLVMLESPLEGFEILVKGHFRTQAHAILRNFKNYMDSKDETMKNLFWKLIKAFEANGSYCKHHCNQVVNHDYEEAKCNNITKKNGYSKLPLCIM
ncbi:putative ubiquitin-conjugating enzyme E2 38 [Arachis stenosperma]|uniref:putative ubiquitin-conjugating enzyme E2 38 n=1 Tax=Arachis stenosperma TaxID=217475 RepID=UPI0025AB9A5D|nr:putative ubiquitin-conjugating enzyme E2 38 [Arachis stenosperma]